MSARDLRFAVGRPGGPLVTPPRTAFVVFVATEFSVEGFALVWSARRLLDEDHQGLGEDAVVVHGFGGFRVLHGV